MKKTKENKGITLISLIITIILMSILVGVTTYSGINSYKHAKVKQFVAQMQLIQTRVDEIVNDSNINIQSLGQSIEENVDQYSTILNNASIEGNTTDFKYFSIESLKNDLDLENIDTDVLINFKTREVVSIAGIEYKGSIYHTQYNLPEGQKLIENLANNRSFEFDLSNISKNNNGLNCEVVITSPITNGTIRYEKKDTNSWQTITNYTIASSTNSINITESGTYTFKLIDNTSGIEKTIEIIIATTNKPKTDIQLESYDYSSSSTSENWANANGYVWIPRFVYKENDDEEENRYDYKFVKGNSNIATDNTYVTSEWILPDMFSTTDEELTGIWIESSEHGLEITDFINLNGKTTLEEINNI